MDNSQIQSLQTLGTIIGIFGVIIILFFFKKIKRGILSIFGGSIELPEAAGTVFLGLFVYMVWKDGNRQYEWHHFNELYILFTAGAAMTGLGLKSVLETVKEIRTGTSSSTEIKIKTETNESEAPK